MKNYPDHPSAPGDVSAFSEEAWLDVLRSVDQTYVELVTYQQKLESNNHELEGMRLFMASVLRSVSDVLIVLTPEGQIVEVSDSVMVQTARPKEALIGRDLADLVLDGDVARLRDLVSTVSRSRSPATSELSLRGPAEAVPLEAALSPRLDDRGRILGLVLTGRPVGELRRAYADLARSHTEMKAAQAQLVRGEKLASLGRLLAGVAHELNNPISFVYANAHALERYVTKFETYFAAVHRGASREELVALREELRLDREVGNLREAMQGARDGAERVRDIVEDLRRLSSDGSGAITRFDLVETARVAATWVLRGTRRAAVLTFEGAERLMVDGRPGHVQQVVMNLVQNAVDALETVEDARITLILRAEAGRAILEVRDNGPGIEAGTAAAIFDPFFTTKPVGRGTGLGLSISHKIAEEHGGRLSLVPTDAGAQFRLDLPEAAP